MTVREIILESRIAELERRLEESCAQNVADNYLVPALSQEVDDLKARNAELVEALKYLNENMVLCKVCYRPWCVDGIGCQVKDKIQSAIRAGKDV